MRITLFILLFLVNNFALAQKEVPNFEDYKIFETYSEKPAKLTSSAKNELKQIKLTNGDSPLDYLERKPNFAAHYEIVQWSCGTPCQQAVIVDWKTGKISANISFCYKLEYKIDSSLIIADSSKRELCPVRFFNLKNGQIVQLNSQN